MEERYYQYGNNIVSYGDLKNQFGAEVDTKISELDLLPIDELQDTTLPAVDNVPREVIKITKNVSEKGEQNEWIYTPDEIQSFAAAEGITSEEYLDRYRVSGSAYSVSTTAVTQEKINKAKSQVSDALDSIEIPTVEVTEGADIGGEDVLDNLSNIKNNIKAEDHQEQIANEFFNLTEFERFIKKNAKKTILPSSDPTLTTGNYTFENRPLSVDEKEFFEPELYKIYQEYKKTGVIPVDDIDKIKAYKDKLEEVTSNVLFDIKDQRTQEFLNEFDEEDRYNIRLKALEEVDYWPETPTGITAFEAEVLRVSKDSKEFKRITGKDLVGKQILNGKVYNSKVNIELLENNLKNYLKSKSDKVETLNTELEDKITAFNTYQDNVTNELNSKNEEYISLVQRAGVFQGPIANAGIQAQLNTIYNEYNDMYNKYSSILEQRGTKLNNEITNFENIVSDLEEKGERFGDLSYLNYAASLNYNIVDRALLNVEKDILGAGSTFFTKTALNLAKLYDVTGEGLEYLGLETNRVTNETMQALENAYGNSVNWQEELQKELNYKYARPIEIRSDNVSSWGPQLFADGVPSLMMVMAPLGVAKTLGYTVRGARYLSGSRTLQRAQNINAIRKKKALMSAGYKTVLGSFFVSETGSKAFENEIDLRKANKLLDKNNPLGLYAQLKKAEEQGLTSEVHALNQRIFEQNRVANDVTYFNRAVSEYLYGTVAMYAEKLGTLRYIQNFQKMAGGVGKGNWGKLFGTLKAGGTGLVIEDIEESVTQFLQNAVDYTVLGENKNWFEGLDSTRFHMQNVVNSLVLQGGNIGTNVGNLMLDEIRTQYNTFYNKKNLAELVEVNKKLKDKTLTAKERQPLIERKRQLITEANLHNAVTYHQLAYMKPADIIRLGELNRQRRDNATKQYELGRSGVNTQGSRTTLDNLTAEMETIEQERNQILNRNKAKNPDQNFLLGVYDLALETSMVKSDDVNNIVEINPEHIKIIGDFVYFDDNFKNNYKAEHLDKIKQLIVDGGNGKNIDGTIYINKKAIMNKINSVTLSKEVQKEFTKEELPIIQHMEAFRAALTPMHELFHNDIENSKFKDSDIFKNGVEELKLHMKNKLGDKTINSAQHKFFLKILDKYKKYSAQEQAEEILPLVYELIEMGMIKPSDFSFLYGIRNSLDNMVSKVMGPESKMFFPFNTNQDVFDYISNFYKTKEAPNVIDTPEEVTSDEAKESLGLTFDETENKVKELNWESLTKEQKLQEGVLLALNWENYIKKRIKSLGFKAPDREIDMMAQEFVVDMQRGLPEIFSRYNPAVNDSISAWALSGKSGWGQLDLRLFETFEKSGYFNAFQVEQDEFIDDDNDVEQTLDVLGFKNNINLPEGVNKKINAGVKKALLKYKDKDLTPKELRDNLNKDFRQIAFKEIKNSFKSRAKYKEYMDKNFSKIFDKMPKTTLAKRFRSDERAVKKYGEDADLFIKPAINPETGVQYRISKTETSQPGVWFKPEFKDIDKSKINDYFFGDKLTPQMISNRKSTVVEEISNELGFDEAINVMFDIDALQPDPQKIKELIPLESLDKDAKIKAQAFTDTLVKSIDRRVKMSVGLGTPEQVNKIQDVLGNRNSQKIFKDMIAKNDWDPKLPIKTLLSRLLLDGDGLFTRGEVTTISKKLNKVFVDLLQIKVSSPKSARFNVLDYLNKFVKEEVTSNDMSDLLKKHGYDAVVYDQTELSEVLDALHVYSLLATQTNIETQKLNTLLYSVGGNSRMGGTKFKWNGKTQTVKEFLDSKNYKQDKSMSTSESRFGLLESVALARTFLKVKGDLEFTIGKDKNGKDIKITRTASSLSKHTSNPTHRSLIKKGYTKEIIKELQQTGEVNQAILIEVADAVRDLFQDGLIGKRALQGFMNSLDSTQKGLLRTGALFGYIPKLSYDDLVNKYKLKVDENGDISITVEHMMPTKFIKGLMFDYIVRKNKTNDFKTALKEYKIAIIPEGLDKLLPSYLKYRMNIGFKIGDKSIDRYINELTKGKFGIELIDLYSATNQTVGKNEQSEALINLNENVLNGNLKILGKYFDLPTIQAQVELARLNDNSLSKARELNKSSKGISVIDFDDTLATSDSKIIVKLPKIIVAGKQYGYETWDDGRAKMTSNATERITPAEYAENAAGFESIGATFNYSEFNQVINGKKGPFFNKAKALKEKFGNTDIFVLTARPAEAANAIQAFLKGVGLDLKVENIIGLEDGRPEAKADWIKGKVNEGYNDFLFADDVLKNVKAVKEVLDVADVKGKVYQARMKASKGLSDQINKIIEQTKGVPEKARFSAAAAKSRGYNIGKWQIFIPPGAEDFGGLMYVFLDKGKTGDQQKEWFNEILFKPFARGIRDINTAKQTLSNEYAELKKMYPEVAALLGKETDYNRFTFDSAIRVYLWDKHGIDIPGLSKRDTKALIKIVKDNDQMMDFANTLSALTKLKEGYVTPDDNWIAGDINIDIQEVNTKFNRSFYLKEWIENKNQIFSPENLNKMEAVFGTAWVDALKDMLTRMETGRNRRDGQNKLVNEFQDWINGSVANIMFLNTRSAVLQMISFANFVNWSDNNMLAASKAFANQPQFWRDFGALFNSDFLKQRRSGLQIDVNVNELANSVATSTKGSAYEKTKAVFGYLLQKGYTPTQIADSTAIALGGASFYRNRIKTYKKQGLDQKEAERKAFADFQEIAESTQQSARPDLISQEQASVLGRLILSFQNVTMQYNRLGKKAILDLYNRRGDDKTNISKIIYYFAIQNMVFNGMQMALFALLFDEETEEKEKETLFNFVNKMSDTIIRGLGFRGAIISTLKNMVIQFDKQSDRGNRADYTYVLLDAINASPPIGSKARKVYSSLQTYKWNKDVMKKMGYDIDNPAYIAVANIVSAGFNIPADRAIAKIDNIRGALNSQNQTWQRIAMALGWPGWTVGVEDLKVNEVRKQIKNSKKRKKKRKIGGKW